MSCATCGTTLTEGAAACTVCDPWAAPDDAVTAPAAPAADGPIPAAGLPTDADVPKWILRMARRNPPARVGLKQLDEAWRNTKKAAVLTVCTYTSGALGCLFGFVIRVPALAVVCYVLLVGGVIAMFCYTRVVKRNFWLSRVIAFAGGQPALGYQGLARIPGIAGITKSLIPIRVVVVASVVSRLYLTSQPTLPAGLRNGSWAMYLVFAVLVSAWQLKLQADAWRDLRRRLAVRG